MAHCLTYKFLASRDGYPKLNLLVSSMSTSVGNMVLSYKYIRTKCYKHYTEVPGMIVLRCQSYTRHPREHQKNAKQKRWPQSNSRRKSNVDRTRYAGVWDENMSRGRERILFYDSPIEEAVRYMGFWTTWNPAQMCLPPSRARFWIRLYTNAVHPRPTDQ